MSAKQYQVHLTAEERHVLEQRFRRGTHPVGKLTRARMLLKAEEGLRDEEIAEAVETRVPTIERTRRRVAEVWFDSKEDIDKIFSTPEGQTARQSATSHSGEIVIVLTKEHVIVEG